ncbi:MAG: glycoside hydrolase family 3 C-terminal domain-containing protein [Anaerovoracaceae bacterium]
MKTEKWMKELTLEEKAALVSGTDFMYTNEIPRLGIPALCMADGPHGLRKQTGAQDNGIAQSEPATAFPTAVATSSSWNPENLRKMGSAIAEECRQYGVHVLLGPGANIKRNPLCGRNFEYFSEDPLLSGSMAGAEVEGVQSGGVGVSVKHFALNNSENYRFMGDSIADDRVIREIYLKSFEHVVRKAHPATMMSAYNRINGTYCAENRWLLTDVLRKEWGFDGAVMTDWGGIRDRTEGLKAGLDLEMPGDTKICRKWILDRVQDGSLPESVLDEAVKHILQLVETHVTREKGEAADFDRHHVLAGEIAADSAVLLKNNGCLPLKGTETLLVTGDLFEKMRYQGAGSSMICPSRLTTPKDAFDEAGITYQWARGYGENDTAPRTAWIEEAVKKAADCNTVLVFAGLTDAIESEGCDRQDLKLPENQLALIDALADAVNGTEKSLIVILFGGGVMELPFAEKADSILDLFLPGQNGGAAVRKLLWGEVSPSGHLSETWPLRYEDVPFGGEFSRNPQEIYKESVYVGYRYYLTADKPVRYPFGYGLSYTTFQWENPAIQREKPSEDPSKKGTITVSCDVRNTGTCAGADVVQLYVKAPGKVTFCPERELRGFAKVYLQPGEKKHVSISLNTDDLRYYSIRKQQWVLEDGMYQFQLCTDCQTVRWETSLQLAGSAEPEWDGDGVSDEVRTAIEAYHGADVEQMSQAAFCAMSGQEIPQLPPSFPVTLESRFTDLQQTFLGKILFHAVLSVANKQMKQALSLPEGAERDNKIKGAQFLKRILESNSVRSMSMSSGKSLPYNLACGFVELTNGHILRGLRCICSPIRVPKLPKEK